VQDEQIHCHAARPVVAVGTEHLSYPDHQASGGVDFAMHPVIAH